MKECILLTHVFVEKDNVNKIDQINFAAEHFRKNNPNAYIIATGHGIKPLKLKNYCDYVYWEEEIRRKEIGRGHPFLVNKGIDHALTKKFPYILKTRLDGINLIPSIFNWCLEQIENYSFLTTQITTKDKKVLCDLFNFSKTKFMKECWSIDNWDYTVGGEISLAKNFLNLSKENRWNKALLNNCKIKDIYNIKWIDFRNNWEILKSKKSQMMNNSLDDYIEYLWGSSEGWLVWNKEGSLIKSATWNLDIMYTEKSNFFYKQNFLKKIIEKLILTKNS